MPPPDRLHLVSVEAEGQGSQALGTSANGLHVAAPPFPPPSPGDRGRPALEHRPSHTVPLACWLPVGAPAAEQGHPSLSGALERRLGGGGREAGWGEEER